MNVSLRSAALLICTAASALVASVAAATPQAVERFDARTWTGLQTTVGQPTAVVFTTTDCAYCPAVMDRLARDIRQGRLKARLVAVVMDAAPGESDRALMLDAHYRLADRLFAFDGDERALRYSVNPGWRGVTPYVAFLRPHSPPMWVTGSPSDAEIASWAAASR